MTLKELIERCAIPDANGRYINVKDATGRIMISADLDYMNTLIEAGDKRMDFEVLKWMPTIFKRHDGTMYPEVTVWIKK